MCVVCVIDAGCMCVLWIRYGCCMYACGMMEGWRVEGGWMDLGWAGRLIGGKRGGGMDEWLAGCCDMEMDGGLVNGIWDCVVYGVAMDAGWCDGVRDVVMEGGLMDGLGVRDGCVIDLLRTEAV